MELLKSFFEKFITTPVFASEYGQPLPDWIEVRAVHDKHLQESLQIEVDAGEASAIALAMESEPSLLIIDDSKGRKAAQRLNLQITGSLGIFLRAKREGIIPLIKPILEKVQGTNFRYSQSVLMEIISLAGE